MTRRARTVEGDTWIIPLLVAETVLDTIEARWTGDIPEKPALAADLAADAGAAYRASADFRRKIRARGNRGRDTLYVFVEHWAASLLKRRHPALYRRLPHGYGFSYSPTVHG